MDVNGIERMAMAKSIMNLSLQSRNIEICIREMCGMTNEMLASELSRCIMKDPRIFQQVVQTGVDGKKDYIIFRSEKEIEFASNVLGLSLENSEDGSKFAVCIVNDAITKIHTFCKDKNISDEMAGLITDILTLPITSKQRVKKIELILQLCEMF